MWSKLTYFLKEKEQTPLDNHNESTRSWSKGYRKAFTETCEFVSKIKQRDNKPLIIGILTVTLMLSALLVLYIRDAPAKIDVNSASVQALESLPDIGPVLAERIIDGRPYHDIEELDRVKGIGPATIDAIKDKATAKEW